MSKPSADLHDADAAVSDPTEELDADAEEPSAIDRLVDRIDRTQRGIAPVAVGFAVTKKFSEDRGGQLAMLLAYKGFFSLFPLLLAFVNGLALVLAGNEKLRDDLIDSALSTVPVIGSEIAAGSDELGGSALVLVGSVLVSLWAGLGLLDMLQESLNTAWQVPMVDRPPYLVKRLKAVSGAFVILFCVVLTGASQWLLADDSPAIFTEALGVVLPVAAGALGYLGLHTSLCVRKVPLRAQVPGMIAIGLGWWGLQALGGFYVTRIVAQSSDTYGVFVVVFGLLSWSYLLGMLYLYSVELAAVLHEHRWPRSLSGRDLTDVDRRALAATAEREARVRGTEITVEIPADPVESG